MTSLRFAGLSSFLAFQTTVWPLILLLSTRNSVYRVQSMPSIAVFVISLKKSKDRRDSINAQLVAQDIPFSFFDAIDGNDSHQPLFKRYNYKKRLWLTSGKMPSKGEIGCYASHYSLWQQCVTLNQPILIIEDDATICSNAGKILPFIKQKIEQYGFLRLEAVGKCTVMPVEQTKQYIISHISNNFWGTRAYAIAPWTAKKLLMKSESWSIPVDNYIGANFIHGIESYYLSPDFAEDTHLFDSTIQNADGHNTPLYRKPSRELYTAYCQIKHYLHNRKIKKLLMSKN